MARVLAGMLVAVSSVAALAAGTGWADDAETQALRKEVEELKRKVQRLEEQQASKAGVDEGAPRAAAPPGSPAAAAAPPAVTQPAGAAGSPPAKSPDASGAAQSGESARGIAEPAVPPGTTSAPPVGGATSSALRPSPGERTTPQATKAEAAAISVPALRESWSRIAKNMPEAEVASVLGAPTTETRINGKRVWYYYYPGIGAGSVFFRANGQVSSHQAPFIGWW